MLIAEQARQICAEVQAKREAIESEYTRKISSLEGIVDIVSNYIYGSIREKINNILFCCTETGISIAAIQRHIGLAAGYGKTQIIFSTDGSICNYNEFYRQCKFRQRRKNRKEYLSALKSALDEKFADLVKWCNDSGYSITFDVIIGDWIFDVPRWSVTMTINW